MRIPSHGKSGSDNGRHSAYSATFSFANALSSPQPPSPLEPEVREHRRPEDQDQRLHRVGVIRDFDLREALTALGDGANLTPAGWRLLLESARSIGSDFNCATLLVNVAPQLPRDADVLAAYRETVATIGSDFDRDRADAALVQIAL